MTPTKIRDSQQTRHDSAASAESLAFPEQVQECASGRGWWPQSLAHGATGIALLHVERAASGQEAWMKVHRWIETAIAGGVAAGPDSHLYYGAPALAFAVHGAYQAKPDSYHHALATLDELVDETVRHRLKAAHARIDAGQLPALAEFDTIRGLAGLGAHLLRRHPDSDLLREVLTYLVRLSEPVVDAGEELPGWWSSLDPGGKPSADFPGGHANTGMAHGIGGPLALLALAYRRGIAVPGQVGAMQRICAWLDRWCQQGPAGPWWPYWVTRRELRTGRLEHGGPSRPSWCYGTAGIARAQHLVGLATGDSERQRFAEDALTKALEDPAQLAAVTDNSLCHGHAGLLLIASRAADDSSSARLGELMRGLARAVMEHPTGSVSGEDPGFLEGAAGIGLALQVAESGTLPSSGWDACLLIS